MPTTPPVTIADIKARLVGLGPWLNAAAALPAPYSYGDAEITKLIPAMVRQFERDTKFRVTDLRVCAGGQGAYDGALPAGPDQRLKTEDAYPYLLQASQQYFRLTLREKPVRRVHRVRVFVGDQLVYSIPPNWFSLSKRSGVFNILPTYGPLLVNSAVTAFAQLNMAFGPYDYLPNSVFVDYDAGLPAGFADPDSAAGWDTLSGVEELDDEYADIPLALAEFCALKVLQDVAQLPDAGLRAVSMSGGAGGESLDYTRFADRKQELEASYRRFAENIQAEETPIPLVFLGV